MEGRKKRKLVTRIVVALVLLGLLAFIVRGFQPQPIAVSVGSVQRRALEVSIEVSGKTRVRDRYVVSAPVLGHLARIALKVGDAIEQAQVIAEIAPMASGLLDERTRNEASARVLVAQANIDRMKVATKRSAAALQFAKEQTERQRTLRNSQGTSQQALEEAEFALRAAEEDLAGSLFSERVAQQELVLARAAVASMAGGKGKSALVLNAPVKGRVLRLLQQSEGVVQPGTPLVEIGDPGALEIVVDVLTTDAVRVVSGAEATIERWGGDKALRARVRSKEPSAFTTRSALGVEEQRVAVVLDLIDPPSVWSSLGDGFRVETRIRTALFPDVLVAPASAVFRKEEGWATFKVAADGKVQETKVQVGARTPEWVELKGGVAAGAELVVYPSDGIKDGALIEVMDRVAANKRP